MTVTLVTVRPHPMKNNPTPSHNKFDPNNKSTHPTQVQTEVNNSANLLPYLSIYEENNKYPAKPPK